MVWSDPTIQKLTREFVTVAEEVHVIYPEGEGNLARIKDDPVHQFFKRFGESMPKKDWNDPGTKQGIYMIGPDAEYLEGGGAISGGLNEVRKRLEVALDRWAKLRKKKKYANTRVPATTNNAIPGISDKPLAFRVYLRDLPRGERDSSGRRFTKGDLHGGWPDFVKWAWNINWLTIDKPALLVPRGKQEEPVDADLVHRICKHALVDNVRGQNPVWRDGDVKDAALQMHLVKSKGARIAIQYSGRATMDSGRQKYDARLFGQGIWNTKKRAFEKLEIVAIGDREGAGTFNQRARDRGPAPMGVVLSLFEPPPPPKRAREH